MPSFAQTTPAGQTSSEFERPFGFGFGDESTPFDAGTRDGSGNRVIVDGRIVTGSDLSTLSTASGSASAWSQSSAGAGFASGTAIGNQLNVITQGSWNTVIVNSTQINNGNQTTVLNGKLDLQ
jgi:holdfast attachment protein HfaA